MELIDIGSMLKIFTIINGMLHHHRGKILLHEDFFFRVIGRDYVNQIYHSISS